MDREERVIGGRRKAEGGCKTIIQEKRHPPMWLKAEAVEQICCCLGKGKIFVFLWISLVRYCTESERLSTKKTTPAVRMALGEESEKGSNHKEYQAPNATGHAEEDGNFN